MKLLANIGIIAIACGLVSAAPSPTQKAATPPKPQDDARVTVRYFAEPAAPGTVQPPRQGENRTDPKWVESMQRVLKDLADDNARLRQENEAMRADSEALKRQLEMHEEEARRRQENRGTFILPPDALRNLQVPQGAQQVPPNWRPFEFNGATYYIVPLRDGVRDGVRNGASTAKGQAVIPIPAPTPAPATR